ncbi:MAG: T9SS type A sorting domain-containing protein, partial [Hymenobacteraceae bacterium]|nr:T9SS type A sorting domain-containing protein [Hymenobacteraceae bacterium]
GTGINSVVNDLALSGTTLYAGGRFSQAGGVPAINVARWDGTAWSPLGAGAGTATGTAYVRAIAASGTTVYVGGTFTTAGSVSANHVARWDGTTWSPLGTGLSGIADCNTLTVAGPDLYMGGYCASVGGVATSGIARWDGAAWSALGTGLNAQAKAIVVAGPDLYVGGGFTTVGDGSKVTACFAAYRSRPAAAPALLSASFAGPTLFPNPATSMVRLTLPAGTAAIATVLDAASRVVRRAAVDAYHPLDVRGLAPGVYAVRVGAATARLVIE